MAKRKSAKKRLKVPKMDKNLPSLKELVNISLRTFNASTYLKAFKYNIPRLKKRIIPESEFSSYLDCLLDKSIDSKFSSKKRFIGRICVNTARHKLSNYNKVVKNRKNNSVTNFAKKKVLLLIKKEYPILEDAVNRALYSFY